MHDLIADCEMIFSSEGALARSLANYEPRPGQRTMAMAVAHALNANQDFPEELDNMLAVEAETGTGKTLAYLVPAALSGRKVVISTGTLNLQEQILNKEIPTLRRHIDASLTALCVKGRQNYLCLYRWQRVSQDDPLSPFSADELDAVGQWLEKTTSGDRAELEWLPDTSPLWREISATSSQCLGSACPDAAACFITLLRKKAARSQLLIVNHHLFFSDLALRRFGFAEVLPRYDAVIFDEAHHIEDIATRHFGASISHFQLMDLARDIERHVAGESTPSASLQPVIAAARGLEAAAARFLALFPKSAGRFPLQTVVESISGWENECFLLAQALDKLARSLEGQAALSEIYSAMQRRTLELSEKLRLVTAEERPSHITWYERREKTVILSASPIEIAAELRQSLYDEIRCAVFTSATLTAGGSFAFFLERLGLPAATQTLQIPSPFDYQQRTRLYVPADFPEPSSPSFPSLLAEAVLDLLLTSHGKALVLCTSTKNMHFLYEKLHGRVPFPLFMQGQAPKQTLLTRFSEDTDSVLLAVASFWEGVDVPGKALSSVIIDKLPFEAPNDPVIMARIEAIRREGGNPFMDFQIPRAILTLRQGLGRLMRSASDAGLLAIMDIRLFSKRYGTVFRRSLPATAILRSMVEVATFFHLLEGEDEVKKSSSING